jgi:hypothetical protein
MVVSGGDGDGGGDKENVRERGEACVDDKCVVCSCVSVRVESRGKGEKWA